MQISRSFRGQLDFEAIDRKIIVQYTYPVLVALFFFIELLIDPTLFSINKPALWLLILLGLTLCIGALTSVAEFLYIIFYIAGSFFPFTHNLVLPVLGIYLICIVWFARGWIFPALITIFITEADFLILSEDSQSRLTSSLVAFVIITIIGLAFRALNIRLGKSRKLLKTARESADIIRSELANQLHDTVAKDFVQIAITARTLALKHPDLLNEITPLVEMAQDASRRVRPMILNLDSYSRNLSLNETILMTQKMLTTRSITLDVDADDNLDRELTPDVVQLSSLFVREAATNVLKYAPASSDANLLVELGANVISLTMRNSILDSGDFPTGISGGFGLGNLQQRIESNGGTLNILQQDGEWVLFASIPLSQEEEHERESANTDR